MTAAASRLTVLVVDDEPRSLETLRRTLDDAFEVLTAESAAAALERMETEVVQLVLSDQRMPGTSGVALLAQIRGQSFGSNGVYQRSSSAMPEPKPMVVGRDV